MHNYEATLHLPLVSRAERAPAVHDIPGDSWCIVSGALISTPENVWGAGKAPNCIQLRVLSVSA